MEDTYQKLLYDLYYIKNWSLSLEIQTIFKTAIVMVGRKGVMICIEIILITALIKS